MGGDAIGTHVDRPGAFQTGATELRKRHASHALAVATIACAALVAADAANVFALETLTNFSAAAFGTLSLVCSAEVLSRLSEVCRLRVMHCLSSARFSWPRRRVLHQNRLAVSSRTPSTSHRFFLPSRKRYTQCRKNRFSHTRKMRPIKSKVRAGVRSQRAKIGLLRAAAAMRKDASKLKAEHRRLRKHNQALESRCTAALTCVERCTTEIAWLRQTLEVQCSYKNGFQNDGGPPLSPVGSSQESESGVVNASADISFAPSTPEMQQFHGDEAAAIDAVLATPDAEFTFAPGTPEGQSGVGNGLPRRTPTFGSHYFDKAAHSEESEASCDDL